MVCQAGRLNPFLDSTQECHLLNADVRSLRSSHSSTSSEAMETSRNVGHAAGTIRSSASLTLHLHPLHALHNTILSQVFLLRLNLLIIDGPQHRFH